MHKSVFYNHEILPASEINLPAISSAVLYGKGVFTTLGIYDSKPFLWEKHWKRLTENAAKLDIEFAGFDENPVKNALFELIEKNKIANARARITFFDTSASSIWKTENKIRTGVLIQTADFRNLSKKLNLTISPFSINSKSPLANVKSCNYLENILALENARKKDFDEAIRLNEHSEIASACMANVFWIKNKKIFTPDLKTGCLAGTTREFLIEKIREKELEIVETKSSFENLLSADEVFLTSSGLNIAIVQKIEDASFDSKISARLKREFFKLNL